MSFRNCAISSNLSKSTSRLQGIKRKAIHEDGIANKKAKTSDDLLDMLQDSFQCFDDTQTLVQSSNKFKQSSVPTVKETVSTSIPEELKNSVSDDDLFSSFFEDNKTGENKIKNHASAQIKKKSPIVNNKEFVDFKRPKKVSEFEGAMSIGFTQVCNSTNFLQQIDLIEDSVKLSTTSTPIQSNKESLTQIMELSLGATSLFENIEIDTNESSNDELNNKKETEASNITTSNIVKIRGIIEVPTTSHTEVMDTTSKTKNNIVTNIMEELKINASHSNNFKVDDEFPNTLNSFLSDAMNSTAHKEIHEHFDKLERTIHQCGESENVPFSSTKIINGKLNNLEISNNESLDNAIINMSLNGQSLSSITKRTLMENVKNTVSSSKLANTTINEVKEFKNHGPFYGLPNKVKELIKTFKGIDDLYEWQNECLTLPSIRNRTNLIYALPTSGGKTLVAEILILREIVCRNKNAIFILPYVAIVQEKVWSLSPFAVALEFLIEEYAAGKGNYPPRHRRRKNCVFICTIEKALGLLNSLIETGRTDEIGLLVVDELHLIGDKSRGSTLETLLSKIMFLKEKIQVVGMSATIGNLNEISQFLKADVYTKNFRPVELIEYVKCGNEIAEVKCNGLSEEDIFKFSRKTNFTYSESLKKIDPDHLGGLVSEVIPDDSCLIFCRSKQNCENVSILLCKVLKKEIKQHRAKEKEVIKRALIEEAGSLCEKLNVSIPYGIAYHHSGLTSEERRIIEEGFRQGVITVICCTSTLAAGVNLPARRVIIRNPYIGMDFINLSRYKQMVGRAGRAGMGTLGESFVICTPQELPRMQKLFMSPMDIAVSSLHEKEGAGLRHFLLSCISLGIATTKSQLQAVSRATLMATQDNRLAVDVKLSVKTAIRDLFKLGALQVEGSKTIENVPLTDVTVRLENTLPSSTLTASNHNSTGTKHRTVVNISNDSKLIISNMGRAAIKGGLTLQRAHLLFEDLMQAQKSLVLFTGLHLMYLVTPYDISEQISITKSHYYTLYSRLSSKELQTANVLGFTEAVAVKLLTNAKITEPPQRVMNRFYVTLMLYDLWNEMPVYEVANKYDINRGLIQNLMTSAATFASNVFHFCEEFEEFWAFSLLLKGMSDRLSHCCIKELIPLMSLPAVKQNRAKQLYKAGYKTLQCVAKADPNNLMNQIEFMSHKLASQLIAASKLMLLEKVENLREEAEDVLDGIAL